MSATTQHHHRSTTKATHKPFKSRFASKNSLRDQSKGKVERQEKGLRRTPHQHVMSKFDRRNNAKQRRLNNQQHHAKLLSVFHGRDGAPRNVAVIPLSDSVSAASAIRSLNSSLDIEDALATDKNLLHTSVTRFNQKLNYIAVGRDLISALDAARVADYILFVLSATEEVDSLGESMIRCIESQGLSQALFGVTGSEAIEPPKRRTQVLASLKSFVSHFFADQERLYALDVRQESQNLMRSICASTPKGIRWREDRSWMLVEDVQETDSKDTGADSDMADEMTTTAILTGVVRGKALKADRLVHITDWGDFQVEKIVAAPLGKEKRRQPPGLDGDKVESETLEEPSEDQDPLEDLAPEEIVMQDADLHAPSLAASDRKGVLLDDHRYFEEDEGDESQKLLSKVPTGTSNYQAAWYLGNVSDSDSDLDDYDDDMNLEALALDDKGVDDFMDGPTTMQLDNQTEAGPSEYPESEAVAELPQDEEDAQLSAYRAKRKEDEKDHLEFPDEVELPPNVLARERLAKYRGLRSLRTSPWDAEEDRLHQPSEWNRLLEIRDYKGAKTRAIREALVGGVAAGTRVQVYIRQVPRSLLSSHDPRKSLSMFSLLRHEHKKTVVNVSITLDADYEGTVKSKEELIMQCGPRRFVITPLFSQLGNHPNDVYKFERFIYPGRAAVASFVAPLTWGAVPTLFFKRDTTADPAQPMDMDDSQSRHATGCLELVARGTVLPASISRVIAKRIVLTGAAYKINRKLVTVRYMFFNPEDVAWFQALQLWTNRGRSGTIKETLGTHGYFKAIFDGKIGMQDAIGISLYKRMWPRHAIPWRAGMEHE